MLYSFIFLSIIHYEATASAFSSSLTDSKRRSIKSAFATDLSIGLQHRILLTHTNIVHDFYTIVNTFTKKPSEYQKKFTSFFQIQKNDPVPLEQGRFPIIELLF